MQIILKFLQTDSVEITKESHLPIYLLHYHFKREQTVDKIAKSKKEFDERFWATIWCCYRQDFKPLLAYDQKSLQKAFDIKQPNRVVKLGFTNDSGWGCTIRVTQMLFCHTILKAELGSYTFKDLGKSDEYTRILSLINDNTDGAQGAFSIQNVVRMSLIFDKHPGEWHGNKSISLVFSHLNKIYRPIKKFEVCIFGDESVYFDKIERMGRNPTQNWLKKQHQKIDELSYERREKVQLIETLFEQYLPEDSEPKVSQSHHQNTKHKWQNAVLVTICVRLGMKAVQAEYLEVIRMFFSLKINVGILGGRPGEAYYLVGLQDNYLIFLDPHNTQPSVGPDLQSVKGAHMSYHESSAQKIHYSKLDPSLGFSFLIKREAHMEQFRQFMKNGKAIHGKNWIFYSMESKPDYMKSKPKKKKTDKKVDFNSQLNLDTSVIDDFDIDEPEKPQNDDQPDFGVKKGLVKQQTYVDEDLKKKFFEESKDGGDDYDQEDSF